MVLQFGNLRGHLGTSGVSTQTYQTTSIINIDFGTAFP